MSIVIEDELSGGASLDYRIANDGEVIHAEASEQPAGVVVIDITDYPVGKPFNIVKLTDKVGNVTDLKDNPIVEQPDPEKVAGPVVTFDTGNAKTTNGWYNQKDLKINTHVKLGGNLDIALSSLVKIETTNITGTIEEPIFFSNDTDPKAPLSAYDKVNDVPIQGKNLTQKVKAYALSGTSVENLVSTQNSNSFTFNYDSLEPEAPNITLAYAGGTPYNGEAAYGKDVILTVTPKAEPDTASPLLNWQYSLDGGTTWQKETPIVAAEQDSLKHTFSGKAGIETDKLLIRVNDTAGNWGTPTEARSLHNKDENPPYLVDLQYQTKGTIRVWFDDKAGNKVEAFNLKKDKEGNGSDKWLLEARPLQPKLLMGSK